MIWSLPVVRGNYADSTDCTAGLANCYFHCADRRCGEGDYFLLPRTAFMKTSWNDRCICLVLCCAVAVSCLGLAAPAQAQLASAPHPSYPTSRLATIQRLETIQTQQVLTAPPVDQNSPNPGQNFYQTFEPTIAPSPTVALRADGSAAPPPGNDELPAPVGVQLPPTGALSEDAADSLEAESGSLSSSPAQDSLSGTSGSHIISDLPTQGQPWWEGNVQSPLRTTAKQLQISLNALLVGALSNSAKVQLISDAPLIAETEITTADAAFDWVSFVDARWDDISEPVGSTLITGGPERLRDHTASFEAGMRRRNTLGGEFEVGQRIGHQNSNSVFFIPQDQGTSRLTLSYTQPLLRGAGKVYNTSLTVLAKLKTKLERDEFERQLQEHLLSITQEYWNLYFERAKYLQQQRLLQNGVKILEELESRREVDALQSQIVRARAAVENRRAQLVRTRLSMKMVEARIRSLVNDSSLGGTLAVELIPMESPTANRTPLNLQAAIQEALQHRPEVDAAIQQVKSASVRMNMGKRETLPLLNVVLETYAAGLEGRSNVGRALNEQFTQGEPSYGLGLQYEYPIWNRAANSKLQKRRLELRRLQHQFRQTVETLKLEVELSVHQVDAAYESLGAKRKAMEAAAAEVAYLFDRWKLLPVEAGSASLLLEDLLEAQDRLADAELGFLQSLVDHNLAQVGLKKSVGTLLSEHQVTIDRNCKCLLPQQEVQAPSLPSPLSTVSESIPEIQPVWAQPDVEPQPTIELDPIPNTPRPPATFEPSGDATRARPLHGPESKIGQAQGYPGTYSRSAWGNPSVARNNAKVIQ